MIGTWKAHKGKTGNKKVACLSTFRILPSTLSQQTRFLQVELSCVSGQAIHENYVLYCETRLSWAGERETWTDFVTKSRTTLYILQQTFRNPQQPV